MEFYQREYFLSRIQLDFIPVVINETKYKIIPASPELEFEANTLYLETLEKEEGLSDEELIQWSIKRRFWSEEKEKIYSDILPKEIETTKIQLYNNYTKSGQRAIYKAILAGKKAELDKLYMERNRYRTYSREWNAEFIKRAYILQNTVIDYSGNKTEIDFEELYIAYGNSYLGSSVIREIARTTPWANIWPVLKANNAPIFPVLSHDKQELIRWSRFYDNIRDSMHCPSDEVIQDDDALDGWLIKQNRKAESERMKAQISEGLGKHGDADEIGLFVDEADVAKVDLLNDDAGRMIKNQRLIAVKRRGELKEHELPDKRQDLLAMSTGRTK